MEFSFADPAGGWICRTVGSVGGDGGHNLNDISGLTDFAVANLLKIWARMNPSESVSVRGSDHALKVGLTVLTKCEQRYKWQHVDGEWSKHLLDWTGHTCSQQAADDVSTKFESKLRRLNDVAQCNSHVRASENFSFSFLFWWFVLILNRTKKMMLCVFSPVIMECRHLQNMLKLIPSRIPLPICQLLKTVQCFGTNDMQVINENSSC